MAKSTKRQENLLAKIAALVNKPVEEIKEAQALYTEEEAALEAMSVLNYYEWRSRLIKDDKETERMFEARQRQWKYKFCKGCEREFAYSYHYDGVSYCSLDCLQKGLQKIGLRLTYGRPLNLRWGLRYPGIVPSAALEAIKLLPQSEESLSDPSRSSLPKSPTDTGADYVQSYSV